MVGDGIKGLDGQAPGEAAQALTAILQTHYLRYLIIVSWAIGVIATVGLATGLAWFAATLLAGALRGEVEKRVSQRVGAGWGMVFPAVVIATTAVWAVVPLLAWFSSAPFGHELAIALLEIGRAHV